MNTEFVTESCFERCEHDKENPYVMISRAMAQDKSISPKAKGVLLYLLSLPKDWKIYHSQLQSGLDVGEDYVNSAIDELINAGYADRTRERVKGIFQPYKYKIREFKKCSPDRENRPGSTGPEKPVLQSKELESKERKSKQQQPPTPKMVECLVTPNVVVVSSVSSDRSKNTEPPPTQKQNIYQELHTVDIPEDQKIEITRNFTLDQVKHALKCVASSKSPIRCLPAFIKKAAAADWQMQPSIEDVREVNRKYAKQFDGIITKRGITIEATNNCIELKHPNYYDYVDYADTEFIPKIDTLMKKCGVLV